MGTRFKAWETAGLPVAKVAIQLEGPPCRAITDRYRHTGRSRDNLYEPQLADSEREAVSDLLAYLENVRNSREAPWLRRYANIVQERRDGLFYRRSASISKHSGVLRERRTPKKCELNVRRDYGARYGSRARSLWMALKSNGQMFEKLDGTP